MRAAGLVKEKRQAAEKATASSAVSDDLDDQD